MLSYPQPCGQSCPEVMVYEASTSPAPSQNWWGAHRERCQGRCQSYSCPASRCFLGHSVTHKVKQADPALTSFQSSSWAQKSGHQSQNLMQVLHTQHTQKQERKRGNSHVLRALQAFFFAVLIMFTTAMPKRPNMYNSLDSAEAYTVPAYFLSRCCS